MTGSVQLPVATAGRGVGAYHKGRKSGGEKSRDKHRHSYGGRDDITSHCDKDPELHNCPQHLKVRGRAVSARFCVWQGAWLVPSCSGRGTPVLNPPHHPLYKDLVCSTLRRQIIPSTPRSASHPCLILDLPASQHPATPACTCFACQ
ncbi:unnamed protein product [Pleuronectes platessa]|uniref:Uncharacterized protein n=1 Tax=Pleuronectes platessa TaxID=8262 RepID=A0A9N7YAP4_PLEPL|nr:unnamed protein product [Pleuronectes platessa]